MGWIGVGFAASDPVVTWFSLAGFAGGRRPHVPGAAPRSRPLSDRLRSRDAPRFLPDAPQWPSESSQGNYCCLLLRSRRCSYRRGYMPHAEINVPGLILLGRFSVTLIGRFWVTPEETTDFCRTESEIFFNGRILFHSSSFIHVFGVNGIARMDYSSFTSSRRFDSFPMYLIPEICIFRRCNNPTVCFSQHFRRHQRICSDEIRIRAQHRHSYSLSQFPWCRSPPSC